VIPAYCPRCGVALGDREFDGRERKWCPGCERPVFRNPVPCAGVTVLDGDRVLLVKRTVDPGVGDWSLPAGHLEVEEEPRAGAARELEEETGLVVDPAALTLLEATQLHAPGEKHVVSVGYAVRAAEVTGTPEARSDAGAVEWVGVDELDARSLRPHVQRRVVAVVDALAD
jgi:ADP-ribose pyrophosphatase YjhB (NUDIX family)